MKEWFITPTKNTWLTIASLVISANICFFMYQYFDWQEGYWSVISVVAVATAKLDKTFSKTAARILGTIFGALYTYFIIIFFSNNIFLISIFISLAIFFTSIISLQKNALSYAGIVGSLTIITICAAGISHFNFYEIARDRTFQVCLGVVVSSLVTSVIYKFFANEQKLIKEFSFKVTEQFHLFKNLKIDRSIFETAIKIIIATLITFLPWLYFRYPGGFWATISCFFIIEESFSHSKEKSSNRLLSHIITAAFGLIAVLLFGNNIWLIGLMLSLGLGFCGYILAMDKPYSTIGNTMGIALCVMLLSEPGALNSTLVIFSRFFNVVFGVIVGVVITSISFTNKNNGNEHETKK